MTEAEKTAEKTKGGTGKSGKKAQRDAEGRPSRSFATRAERSLKDADRLFKNNAERSPEEQAASQMEQAKVWALLNLADAIRDGKHRA